MMVATAASIAGGSRVHRCQDYVLSLLDLTGPTPFRSSEGSFRARIAMRASDNEGMKVPTYATKVRATA